MDDGEGVGVIDFVGFQKEGCSKVDNEVLPSEERKFREELPAIFLEHGQEQ